MLIQCTFVENLELQMMAMVRVDFDSMKRLGKSLLKYYLLYHLFVDLMFVGFIVYWHFADSQYIWYQRFVHNPAFLVESLITGPTNGIISFFELIILQIDNGLSILWSYL